MPERALFDIARRRRVSPRQEGLNRRRGGVRGEPERSPSIPYGRVGLRAGQSHCVLDEKLECEQTKRLKIRLLSASQQIQNALRALG